MREHKYKAWDKTNNQWYMDGNVFDLNYSGSYGDFYFDNDNPYNMREVELEWVEFTGLKDKNGKEIYEGDILSYFKEKIAIEWNEHGLFLGRCIGDNLVYHNLWFMLDNLEVIGNIYENPELLEDA